MKLGENHTLEADGNGFTLTYEKEGEMNPVTSKPILTRKITYHSNLEQSLEAYVKHCMLLKCQSEDAGLTDVLEKLKEVYGVIKQSCAELKIKKEYFTKITLIQ